MSTLTLGQLTLPAAWLGGESPLPPLRGFRNPSSSGGSHHADAGLDYPDKGSENVLLPYRLMDRWDRSRNPRTFKTVVLENEILRATFTPELGGRLWSLIHKPTGRELLFANPVFQPGNVAVRGAWITSGVEWNISIFGHSPLTLEPLFFATVKGPNNTPVLRLYEFERIRRVVFQIDCWLPDGSEFLFVRPRIINPHDYIIPMYWWSNIAVAEVEGTRVLAPADASLRHDYDHKLTSAPLPMHMTKDGEEFDATYATNRKTAADMYFEIREGQRPWVASLDQQGLGLIQASTSRLRGRKMWAWGTGRGSRRWLHNLSDGAPTMEIQGGLMPTQSQYTHMHPKEKWSWLEAYGLMRADPAKVHGEWPQAWRTVDGVLESVLPSAWMEQELHRTEALADAPIDEIIHTGSGWGALERKRREKAGEPPIVSDSVMSFPDTTLGQQQQPWLALLLEGELPYRKPSEDPGSLMVQPEWHQLLESAVKHGRGDHWLSWYHLGLMRYRAKDKMGAKAAWRLSIDKEPSAWVLRNLACFSRDEENNLEQAADLYLQAGRMAPHVEQLATEVCVTLFRVKRYAQLVEFAQSLPKDVWNNGRIRMLHAAAALEVGDLEPARQFFEEGVEIYNVREAEVSVTDLWFEYHEHRLSKELGVPITEELIQRVEREFPPPLKYDFRMHGRRRRAVVAEG